MDTVKIDLEDEIFEFGKTILEGTLSAQSGFSLKGAENRLIEWSLSNEDIKTNLFRFVDVLPSLATSEEIVQHVHEYFSDAGSSIPLFNLALKVSPKSILSKLGAVTAKSQVSKMSRRFIVGNSPGDALKYLKKLRVMGRCFTVDLLGEASLSEEESLEYLNRYKELIVILAENAQRLKEKYPLKIEHPKDKSPLNISIKLSALYSQAKAIDFDRSVEILAQRLGELLSQVKAHGGAAYVDMEDCAFTDITLEVVKRLFTSEEFRSYEDLGIVLQAYLKRTESDLEAIRAWVIERKCPINVRLVKGAYWDSEVMFAKMRGWEVPVFEGKSKSDANYEKLSRYLLQNRKYFYPAFASHNVRSISHAICFAKSLGLDSSEFELQTLYGMGDEFKDEFVNLGYLVREYSPVGELLPGMAYLVRRLLENTANEGFLKQTSSKKLDFQALLQSPISI